MRHPLPLSLVALALSIATPGQNLIDSPGFESGSVSCLAQGELPLPWRQAGLLTIGADTYSVDCSMLTGLGSSWTNFDNDFAAHCGLRWTAGGNNTTPLEAIGAPLLMPLQPNTTYLFAGWFRRNNRPNVQGNTGYDLAFGPAADIASASLAVPAIAAGSTAFAWREHEAVFTTDASTAGATHVVLVPVPGPGQVSYMGIDDTVLAEVGGFYRYPEGVANDHALQGSGVVTPAATFQLTANSTHAGAVCLLATGIDSGCAPALGQTLTTVPLVTTWTLTDAAGGASFPFTWPATLPTGTRAYFQTWILTAGGAFSASNGVAAVGG